MYYCIFSLKNYKPDKDDADEGGGEDIIESDSGEDCLGFNTAETMNVYCKDWISMKWDMVGK